MNNKSFRIFNLVLTLLLAVGFFAGIYILIGGLTGTDYLIFIIQALVSLFAIFYMQSGFRKEKGSLYYKCFMISLAVLVFVSLIRYEALGTVNLLLLVIQFGALCILFVGTDMGVKASCTLGWIVVGCSVVHIPAALSGGALSVAELLKFSVLLVLSLSALLMVYAKYADKKARGTK